MLPIKLVTLGEGRVGKSSLLLRFSSDSFDANNPSTLAASFIEKRLIVGSIPVTLNLWDTAGQECFHALGPLYYRDADCALLVFDLTDADSFAKVKRWVAELRTMVGPTLPICLAGNKSDLNSLVDGLAAEAEQYAQQIGAKFYPTSALLNRNVDACFLYLCNEVVMLQQQQQASRGGGGGESEDDEEEHRAIRLGTTASAKNDEDQGGCCV